MKHYNTHSKYIIIIICNWILENRPCMHIWPNAFIGPANSHTHTLAVY